MRQSKSGLFLLELMIAILFFALASSVCLQIFVKSYKVSQSSENLNHAVNITQSIFAKFESDDYANQLEEKNYEIYFDKDWMECKKDSSVAKVVVSYTKDSETRYVNVQVFFEDEMIYEQDNHYHIQQEKTL